jgi:hypothetical protein
VVYTPVEDGADTTPVFIYHVKRFGGSLQASLTKPIGAIKFDDCVGNSRKPKGAKNEKRAETTRFD